jgi:hypothetical protein
MKLVFDIETQNTFADVGGKSNLTELKISVVGVYWYPTNEYLIFTEENIDELEELMTRAEVLIGFNSRGFDNLVLQTYFKRLKLNMKKSVDIMVELENILGYKISLNSVAEGTLGELKSGHGLEAVDQWRRGELEALKKYCLDDVRITKAIYEYGLVNKMVKFKSTWDIYEAPVEWE